MTNYAVSTIVTDVRTIIDEIQLNEALLIGGTDEGDIDTIIKSKIVEAVRQVLLNARADSLRGAETIIDTNTISERTIGGKRVVVASTSVSDLLRFMYATAESWAQIVTEPITYLDAEYASLSDRYATGDASRPKVGIRPQGQGYEITLYSLSNNQEQSTIAYIAEPKLIEGKVDPETIQLHISLLETLYRPCLYQISGLTLLTLRDAHADSMFNQARLLLGVNEGQQ